MHLLSEPDVSRILRNLSKEQCHDLLDALSESLVTVSAESSRPDADRLIHQPLRTTITTKDQNLSLFMPVSNTASTGIKIVTASQRQGIVGVINIFSPEGRLLGLLSAAEVTAFRTALATMTLFTRCTALTKHNIVIFGSGRQAEWHARLALLLEPKHIRRITFVNRGRSRLAEMERSVIADLRASYPDIELHTLVKEENPAYEETLRAALAACDAVFSCTPSTEPNFPYAYLTAAPRRRFFSLIGSYKPHMREVDTQTVLSGGGKIYVDSREACLEESGELITAQVQGEQLVEIGELYGRLGRSEAIVVPEGCNVMFKCVGMGIMDLVIGKKLLDIGRELGLGMSVDGF
ncbi:putative proline utilization protein PrnX [Aspergillus clavatus NRRL 1]|uniref:Ornithine cyclodeaminase/mu-crystallin family protein n=1 Tax=Aspergillus clavatus (strain ATCC 1007 / CBS 513.65 / DSM 816 / NCTC 3887 / NRRL 1 / QM 1276 / 107) TaxID=344612 RepID=A1CTN1_ASPCL|nr:ornithine cyclodeaminase/mu-crystallin family protein [Aspergillus clavatus NRRL 1]EAW06668.1 ornithine cyclodeaminase/mu-crystallin family protein [Aspergillus clavatus NRRL 1]